MSMSPSLRWLLLPLLVLPFATRAASVPVPAAGSMQQLARPSAMRTRCAIHAQGRRGRKKAPK